MKQCVYNLQLTIPAQDGERTGVKIKPREVRSWLDNLPLLDLERAARLAREQLRLMNRQVIPAAARLQILGDFLGVYQRLRDALNPAGKEFGTLDPLVKRLCQDIGFGYKIVIHNLVNKPGGFREMRNLPLALLGAIHVLGQQLLDYYARYRRTPRVLWSECLALYACARDSGRETFAAPLPAVGELQIDACFRLIALLRLADPYRLPSGMVVPLHDYFLARIDLCSLHAEPPVESDCFFRITDSVRQAPATADPHLYLDLDPLLAKMSEDLAQLTQHRQTQRIGLPTGIPVDALLRGLVQTRDHWRHYPTRATDREETRTRVELICGYDAVYCAINNGRRFDPKLFATPGQDEIIDLGADTAPADNDTPAVEPVVFSCVGVNHSRGGLAVRYRGLQTPHPQVGQLLALRRAAPQSKAGWVVAVCRWLTEPEGDNGFELGIQYLAREPRAVVIRARAESGSAGDYQAAIAATQRRRGQRVQTLITRSGNVPEGGLVTIFEQGRQQQVRHSEGLESGPGFERFIYTTA